VPSEADRQSKSANPEHLALSTEDFACLLEKAGDFHGHLGPFLVVGVRAGLRGLRELQARKENLDVSAKARLTYSVPYSCILDGIQVATGCTIGNTRLTYEDSSNPMILFRNKAGRAVAVSILPEAAAMADEELFKVAPV